MSQSEQNSDRRTFLKATTVGVAAAVAGLSSGKAMAAEKAPSSKFYKADGSFDADAAKNAYYALMKRFNYPIPKFLRTDNFWVCDFMQGDYAKLGMGGVFWINENGKFGEVGDKKYKGKYAKETFGYLGHDIFVLPGQALPEHRHIGGEGGWGPKMESWHVRHGSADFFGQHDHGEEKPIDKMPAAERPWGYGEKWFKSTYFARRTEQDGTVYTLKDPESWHFLRAGPEGAIISEYATYHNHVMFSKPKMAFDNTKAKKA